MLKRFVKSLDPHLREGDAVPELRQVLPGLPRGREEGGGQVAGCEACEDHGSEGFLGVRGTRHFSGPMPTFLQTKIFPASARSGAAFLSEKCEQEGCQREPHLVRKLGIR